MVPLSEDPLPVPILSTLYLATPGSQWSSSSAPILATLYLATPGSHWSSSSQSRVTVLSVLLASNARTQNWRSQNQEKGPCCVKCTSLLASFSCCSYGRVFKHKTHQHLLPCKMWHDCLSCDGSLSWLYARCLCSCNYLKTASMHAAFAPAIGHVPNESRNQKETWRDGTVRWDYH